MTNWLRHLAACLMAGLLLSACGPGEAEQRKAFIEFLQKEVMTRPGARMARPNEEKQKSFGDYAKHYAVITDFHDRMDKSIARPMQEAMARGVPRTIEDVVNRKGDIAAVRTTLLTLRDALDKSLATADAERAALKQPADLAAAYGPAYDKLVTTPTSVFRQVFPTADEAFSAILAFADLVESNRGAIKLSGSQMEVANPALREKIQSAMTAMNAKQRAINEAQQKVRATLFGN